MDEMRTRLAILAAVVFVVSITAQQATLASKSAGKVIVFDGSWWLTTPSNERDGASDCLTWVAHLQGFSSTPEQLREKITQYYLAHPSNKHSTVMDVWQKLTSAIPRKPKKATKGGDAWKNPHWYLNGGWWRQVPDEERKGFLEGYLLCMLERVNPPTEEYSRSISFYAEKIDAHIQAHPKANDDPVAIILSRFRDRPTGKAKD